MKKFRWRLQRLLDLKNKQEQTLRSELIVITGKTVSKRSRLMLRRASLQQMLGRIKLCRPEERLAQQRFFLAYSHVAHEQIKKMEFELAELETQRRKKIAEIMAIRKFRKGLEKLREKARIEFEEEQNKIEQKQLDERTTDVYARRILQGT